MIGNAKLSKSSSVLEKILINKKERNKEGKIEKKKVYIMKRKDA